MDFWSKNPAHMIGQLLQRWGFEVEQSSVFAMGEQCEAVAKVTVEEVDALLRGIIDGSVKPICMVEDIQSTTGINGWPTGVIKHWNTDIIIPFEAGDYQFGAFNDADDYDGIYWIRSRDGRFSDFDDLYIPNGCGGIYKPFDDVITQKDGELLSAALRSAPGRNIEKWG